MVTDSRSTDRRLTAISAHRGGGEDVRPGSYEAYRAALDMGADYVEFDIRRTGDGRLVVFHDEAVSPGRPLAGLSYAQLVQAAGYEVPVVPDLMRMFAGRAAGHLDLKEQECAAETVGLALDILGPDGFVATTLEDACAAAVHAQFPAAQVALSLGRGLGGLSWQDGLRVRAAELSPMARIRDCGASWCAMHYRLARAGALRQCHGNGIKTMVWTVNSDRQIARLLADPRVDVVVTDRPRRARELRDRWPALASS